MKSKLTIVISMKLSLLAGAILGFCSLTPALPAAPGGEQKGFSTAKEAADALVQAADPFDVPALEAILGPGSEDLVASEDTVQDKNRATRFAEMAHEKNAIEVDPKNSRRATLSVGNDDWPLPIPIVKRNGKWYFDAKAGREEVLLRRIGANELDVLNICRGYVDAQEEYAADKHDGSTVTNTPNESLVRLGSRMVWPGKMPMEPGVARSERMSPRPWSKAIAIRASLITVTISRF